MLILSTSRDMIFVSNYDCVYVNDLFAAKQPLKKGIRLNLQGMLVIKNYMILWCISLSVNAYIDICVKYTETKNVENENHEDINDTILDTLGIFTI